MGIRILLADDHKIMREGLKSLIEKQPGMEVIADAENGRAAVRMAADLKPDLVVMDISMPDLNGIEATHKILSDSPGRKILALSMHSDRQFVVGMFRAGASGYLLKGCAFEELAEAIEVVAKGNIYLSPKIAGMVIKDYLLHVGEKEATSFFTLSSREREVLQLIAEGRKTKEIADRLHISVKTVETHRRQIMEKMNIDNVAELTKLALREGLTSL